ncbi:MAG: ComEC/Rec2 family competence protein [Bacilli bacterium]
MHRTMAVYGLVACLGTALALRGQASHVLGAALTGGILAIMAAAVKVVWRRLRTSAFHPSPVFRSTAANQVRLRFATRRRGRLSPLASHVTAQRAAGVLVACVMLAAGSIYGVWAQMAEHAREASLFAFARNGTGSMDAIGEIEGALEPSQHSVGVPCRILAVYDRTGLVPVSTSPTIWLALSLGRPAATGPTKGTSTTVLRFYDSVMSLHPGDYISVYIRIHKERPGPFAVALARRSITLLGTGSIYGVNRLRGMPGGADLYAVQGRWLSLLQTRMRAEFGQTVSGFLLAFSIGDRSLLNRRVVKVFAAIGIVHALVASGATVRMTVSPVVRLLRRSLRRTPLWYPVGLVCTALLVLLTDFAPPAVRAAVAYAYELTATFWNRPADRVTGNVIALGVLMGIEPEAVFDPGILLSYCAVTVLAQLPAILRASVLRGMRPRRLAQIISRGLAADVGITPLAALEFGQFSPLSLIANIALYPFLELAIPASLLLCAGGLASSAFGTAVRPLLAALFTPLQNGVLWLGELPLTHRVSSGRVAILLYYGAILLFLGGWNRYSFRRRGKYLQL